MPCAQWDVTMSGQKRGHLTTVQMQSRLFAEVLVVCAFYPANRLRSAAPGCLNEQSHLATLPKMRELECWYRFPLCTGTSTCALARRL